MHYKSPPCPWHAALCSSWSFPSGGNYQTLLCIQCLVGFLHNWGHTVNNSLHPPQHTPRLLQFRLCRHHEHYKYSRCLFRQILTNPNHVRAHLLPEKVNLHYQLRPRQHDRQLGLIPKTTKLYSCNLVIRMLFERIRGAFCDDALYKLTFTFTYTNIHIDFILLSVHWLFLLLLFYYCLILYKLHSDSLILNQDDDDDDLMGLGLGLVLWLLCSSWSWSWMCGSWSWPSMCGSWSWMSWSLPWSWSIESWIQVWKKMRQLLLFYVLCHVRDLISKFSCCSQFSSLVSVLLQAVVNYNNVGHFLNVAVHGHVCFYLISHTACRKHHSSPVKKAIEYPVKTALLVGARKFITMLLDSTVIQ